MLSWNRVGTSLSGPEPGLFMWKSKEPVRSRHWLRTSTGTALVEKGWCWGSSEAAHLLLLIVTVHWVISVDMFNQLSPHTHTGEFSDLDGSMEHQAMYHYQQTFTINPSTPWRSPTEAIGAVLDTKVEGSIGLCHNRSFSWVRYTIRYSATTMSQDILYVRDNV